MLWRGPLDAKLRWIFSLYDRDHQGYLSQNDVLRVLRAVYDMMGDRTCPPTLDEDVAEHAKETFQVSIFWMLGTDHGDSRFQKLDMDNDGKISFEDFMLCCREVRRPYFCSLAIPKNSLLG